MRPNFPARRHSKSHLHPSLRAALVLLIPAILVRAVSAWFAILAWLWLLIFGLLYILVGYTAGRFQAESVFHVRVRGAKENARQQGAGAGILLFLLGWGGYAVLMAAINLFLPFAPVLPIGALFIFSGFVEFVASMGLGAFGASRYR